MKDSLVFNELLFQTETTTGTQSTFTWPVRTVMDGTQYAPAYQVKYLESSIQIHPPTQEEFIEKMGDSIQKYFGIQEPLLSPKIDNEHIEERKIAIPVPLPKGRRIERV